MGESLTQIYSVVSLLFIVASMGTAIAAFMKLSTTPAGLAIGGSSVGSALVSILGRVLRLFASPEQMLPISLASSLIGVLLAMVLAAGIFLLPESIDRLIEQSRATTVPR